MVVDGGKVLLEGDEYLGKATNNVAEYTAIIRGLEDCIEHGHESVQVFSDSQLCIYQINGEYRVRKERLKPLHDKVTVLRRKFRSIGFTWVERENEWTRRCDGRARGIVEGRGGRGV